MRKRLAALVLCLLAGCRPAGFLPDGRLVTRAGGAPLRAYWPGGQVRWERDPFLEARERFSLAEGWSLVGGSGEAFIAPAGEVYYTLGLHLVKGSETETVEAAVVYDAAGELLSCEPGCAPGFAFTPWGTVIGPGEEEIEAGWVYHEYAVEKGRFTFRRKIKLPSPAIYGAAGDRSMLCILPACTLPFVVYREGARRALFLTLPEGHIVAGTDGDGHLYTYRLREDALVVTAWRWPRP